jgi:hypothetical protein
MDEFVPIVGGGAKHICCFFYGGIVDTTNDIDEWLKLDGVPTTCFGVRFDELVDVDQIDDGNVDDEVKTA